MFLSYANHRSYRLIDNRPIIEDAIIAPSKTGTVLIGDDIDASPENRVLYAKDEPDSVLKLQKRGWVCSMRIPGIIVFVSKFKYGVNKSGTPFYLFYPLLPFLPTMIVASSRKFDTSYHAIVEFNSWLSAKDHPRANLVALIGPVGDMEVEHKAIAARVESPMTRPLLETAVLPSIDYEPTSKFRHEIFNIDPPGCVDIDDIIMLEYPPDNKLTGDRFMIITIGIADLARLVPEGSPLDSYAYQRAYTGYLSDKRISMLPEYIEKAASVLPGEIRGIVSLKLIVNLTKNKVTSSFWTREWIRNAKSYTYESARGAFPDLAGFIGSEDPHVWVEYLMRLYNKDAAEYISKTTGVYAIPFRLENSTAVLSRCEKELPEKYAFLDYHSSIYTTQNTGYAHASSPIRRYADIITQRVLVDVIEGTRVTKTISKKTCEWLNYLQKIVRDASRDSVFYSQIKTGVNVFNGILIQIKPYEYDKLIFKFRFWIPSIRHQVSMVYRYTDGVVFSRDNFYTKKIKLEEECPIYVFWDENKTSNRFQYSLFGST